MADKPKSPSTEPEDGTSDGPRTTELNGEAAKWKAMARKHESAAKSLQARLDEADEAEKSELDRYKAKLVQAEADLANANTKVLRLEVAADKGLSLKMAKRLSGDSREDLEADADDLIQSLQLPKSDSPDAGTDGGAGNRPPSRKPVSDLKGGADPDAEPPEEIDPDKLAAKVRSY